MPDNEPGLDGADEIALAWQRERPGTSTESIGIVTRIWRLAKLFGEDRRRVLADVAVDAATLDLLSTLRRSGPPYTLTTREIAQRTLITGGAVSQRVARAEQAGLVQRSPQPDGRAVLVELTPHGHTVVEHTVDRVLDREVELLAGLTPTQRHQLTDLLRLLLRDVQSETGTDGVSQVGEPDVPAAD